MIVYPGVQLSALGASPPIVLIAPLGLGSGQPGLITSLGLICTLSPGAVLTYSVQVSGDDTRHPITNWNDHNVLSGLTGGQVGNVAFPISALRLNVTAYTSGSINLGVVQWP